MLKRQSRVLSIALIFVFCMSFMFAGFAAPDVASASSNYTVVRPQNVSDIGDTIDKVMIQIDIPNDNALTAGDKVTIHLPSELEFTNVPVYGGATVNNPMVSFDGVAQATEMAIDMDASPRVPKPVGGAPANVRVFAPASTSDGFGASNSLNSALAFVAYPIGNNAIEIQVDPAGGMFTATGNAARLQVELKNVRVKSTMSGDMVATIFTPSGTGFTEGTATIGKFVSAGAGTLTIAKSITTMGDQSTLMDNIMIQETVKNSIENGEVIKVKLPNGFTWDITNVQVQSGWAYTGLVTFTAGQSAAPAAPPLPALPAISALQDNDRTLVIVAPAAGLGALPSEGRIYITDARIVPGDNAKFGDVNFTISSTKGNVTNQTVTIAKYADFEVKVEEDTIKEVVAGWNDTDLGSFIIEEQVEGSIMPRTVNFKLPNGVKWNKAAAGPYIIADVATTKLLAGTDWIPANVTFHDNDRTLRMTVAAFTGSASKIKFDKLNVNISPDFLGDITVEVDGSAGIKGSAKVAEVKAPISVEVENVNDVIIGAQDQKIANIKLIEPVAENWKADLSKNDQIVVTLPAGASFAKTPTVSAEGELGIDKVDKSGGTLTITLDGTSVEAGVIEISDIYVTTDRTVPEGDFKLYVSGKGNTRNALTDNAGAKDFDVATITSKVIAKCVTPAPVDGTTGAAAGQFKIDSNIYQLNGVAKVMDVAPYIKSGRTYVPVRYLGYALGVAEADVVWDEGSQKVTLTKGDNVVELTIGSTTITVNGEAQTVDVAPEITNGRTMLPARYVAEGLGYVVGWDPSTRTVLISK